MEDENFHIKPSTGQRMSDSELILVLTKIVREVIAEMNQDNLNAVRLHNSEMFSTPTPFPWSPATGAFRPHKRWYPVREFASVSGPIMRPHGRYC